MLDLTLSTFLYTPLGYNDRMNNQSAEAKKIVNRLHRIEGQVRGIEKMVDLQAPLQDVVVQVQAIQSAMVSVKKMLIEQIVKKSESPEKALDIIKKHLS